MTPTQTPQNSHTFVLFDQDPPKIGNCMTPVHFVAACFLVKKFLVEFSHMQQRPWTFFLEKLVQKYCHPQAATSSHSFWPNAGCEMPLDPGLFFEANNFWANKKLFTHKPKRLQKKCVHTVTEAPAAESNTSRRQSSLTRARGCPNSSLRIWQQHWPEPILGTPRSSLANK